MRRFLNPFVLIFTPLVILVYIYAAVRLTDSMIARLLLALPFLCVWMVPVFYWAENREERNARDNAFLMVSYLSMGWLSFLFLLLLTRDAILVLTLLFKWDEASFILATDTNSSVLGFATLAVAFGAMMARRGPTIREVDIPFPQLAADLDGFRIVQISDLHVGPTIHRPYVERVVQMCEALTPDMVVLTGDIVDGSVAELKHHIEPLARLPKLCQAFFIMGNHDYYSGAAQWIPFFRDLGFQVLLNEHIMVKHGTAAMLVGGVLDPAVKMFDRSARPDPQQAMQQGNISHSTRPPDLRLLLAHNPKLAYEGAKAGFDLQLSGHTHAGQFIPWTLVARLVHQPHFAGLSREGQMWVYVSAGTGTWGPPVRVGTSPELSLIQLKKTPIS